MSSFLETLHQAADNLLPGTRTVVPFKSDNTPDFNKFYGARHKKDGIRTTINRERDGVIIIKSQDGKAPEVKAETNDVDVDTKVDVVKKPFYKYNPDTEE
jgi:hypothetical protein